MAMKDISPAQAIPALLRDGRYRYVPGVLDEDTPWLMRHLVSVMSANVLIDSYVIDRIRDLSTRAALVYAMKFRSVYDLHFLRTRLAQLGLPVPCFVFGMSSFHTASWGKLFEVQRARVAALIHGRSQTDASERSIVADILKHGGAAVMFLVDEKTFRPRYIHPDRDPLAILLDVQGVLPAPSRSFLSPCCTTGHRGGLFVLSGRVSWVTRTGRVRSNGSSSRSANGRFPSCS